MRDRIDALWDRVVRPEDLELPALDLIAQIQDAALQAYERQAACTMGELIAGPDRVYEGTDGSVWILAPDQGPGVELRGWPIWR